MPDKLWIQAIDVTKGTPMGGNIDANKYVNVIKENQVFLIEPILGTKLYDKINTDVQVDSVSGIYLQMLDDYIKPILIYSVAAEYILTSSYNVANGGIFKHQPENGQAVSKTEVDYLAQNQRAKADVYVQRLQKFLCDQQSDIPEYTSAQDNNYDIDPNRESRYTGGWHLGSKKYVHRDAMYYLMKDIYESEGK